MLQRILIAIILAVALTSLFLIGRVFLYPEEIFTKPEVIEISQLDPIAVESPKDEDPALTFPEVVEKSTEVPFVAQAPFGEWSDSHFQNGCEEASLIMAEHWYTDTLLTKEVAKEEILRMEKFEEKRFGTFIDTSLEDTEKIWKEYYGRSGSSLVSDIVIKDIVKAIEEKNLVIIPADGRELKNPNFSQPGPPRHMLVVIGYDPTTKEFITNDPGTRNGKNYRYKEEVLYGAILDYPTGNHVPTKSERKVMLVISRD